MGNLGRSDGFTLSRQVPGQKTALPPIEKGPVRVLLFTSLPDDLSEQGRLDVEEEQAYVQEALAPLERDGLVILEMPDDGRFETFRNFLKKFRPHLVYLSGHGNFYYEPHKNTAWGTFLFEDEWGAGVEKNQDEIAACFENTNVQALVLSACKSGKSASEIKTGLVLHLSGRIPHVIGMRESIADFAGMGFASAFFESMAAKERPDIAVQAGRQAISGLANAKSICRRISNSVKAEISSTHWPFPMLVSRDIKRPVIDWNFEPKPKKSRAVIKQSLKDILLPERFIGRRRELRKYQNLFRQDKINALLITGPGGIGKTALSGKLVQSIDPDSYKIFAWSARGETKWDDFIFDLEIDLDPDLIKKLDRAKQKFGDNPEKQAEYLLKFLMVGLEKNNKKPLIFLDNLESIQDEKSLAIKNKEIKAFIDAARSMTDTGLKLIITSRWKFPDWPGKFHCNLGKPVYGDFFAVARRYNLTSLIEDNDFLRRAYDALGGNFRGLEFFNSAIEEMSAKEKEDFLKALEKAEQEAHTNMAISRIVKRCSEEQKELLCRMQAYHTPVPFDGIKKLALPDFENTKELLQRLLDVSLVEQYEAHDIQALVYQVCPLVRSWMEKQDDFTSPDTALLEKAAQYQLYLFKNERKTVEQAMIAHKAMIAAGMEEEAHIIMLGYINPPLSRAGFYRELVDKWLPPALKSRNEKTRGVALNVMGLSYLHLGEYDKALPCFEQSLEIRKAIGDKDGEGTTLSNMGTIALHKGDYEKALSYYEQALEFFRKAGKKSEVGTLLNNISQIYSARGDYEKALSYLEQALEIKKAIGDKAGEGTTLNNIGQIYSTRGDYEKALSYLEQALEIAKAIGDKSGEGRALNNISQIYSARGDYEKALSYLEQALEIRKAIGDKDGQGTTLSNMGAIALHKGDYEKALSYLEQALEISKAIGDKACEGTTLNNIAVIYKARGDYDKTLSYLEQALEISKAIGDKAGLCVTLFNMGHIYLKNEEIEKALKTWAKVYSIAKPMQLAETLNDLKKLAENLGLPGGVEVWEILSEL